MPKTYIAVFSGDIEYNWYTDKGMKPMADNTLEGLLNQIVEITGWGNRHWDEFDSGYYYSPDPEDDKIEIWEVDGDNKTAKIVWGFFGWHWHIPDGLSQGMLPGHSKSLYDLAMEGY